MQDITIAAASFNCRLDRPGDNLAALEKAARRAKERGASVLICPEACLTGYGIGPEALKSAVAADGEAVREAAALAARLGLSLVVGLMERTGSTGPENGKAFLTQLALDAQGRQRGLYRKVHLGPTETDRFQPGRELGLVTDLVGLGGLKIGLQLCYDGHFPQQSSAQARAGAELITVCHASPGETPDTKKDRWLRYLAARAYDNTVFLATCNQLGDNGQGMEFPGLALILGPKGEILAQHSGPEPGLAVAQLPAAYLARIRASRMGYFRDHGRPEVYAAWRRGDEESDPA